MIKNLGYFRKGPVFDTSSGKHPNDFVQQIMTFDPDELYVGGRFSSFAGQTLSKIARIHADTAKVNTALSITGVDGTNLYTMEKTSDESSFYIGGDFTNALGSTRQRIAKISSGGTLDTTFNTSTGANALLNKMVRLSDGSLIICGDFTTYKGTTRSRIAKINGSTGALDGTFDPTTSFSGGTYVYDMVLDSTGNYVYVAGNYTGYKGTARWCLSKIAVSNAALDATFNISTGCDNAAYCIMRSSDNYIFAGGRFTTYKGTTRQGIVKVNSSTGALDTTFNTASGIGGTPNNILAVYDIVEYGNSLFVAGDFATYKGSDRRAIVKVDKSTGALDTTFLSYLSATSTVYIMHIHNNYLYVGGSLRSTDGDLDRLNIVKIDPITGHAV